MSVKRITDLSDGSTILGGEYIEVSQISTTVKKTAVTISAIASDHSFNDSGAGFVTAGFAVNDRVHVTGSSHSANNIIVGQITALTASKMTIDSVFGAVIVDETAGSSVTISKWTSRKITVAQSRVAVLDTDVTLAANSDANVASQKAVKTYVDTLVAGAASTVYVKPLLASFTQVNMPTSGTATDVTGALELSAVALASTFNLNLLQQTAPGTPWTRWARMTGGFYLQYSMWGLAVSDGSGKVITLNHGFGALTTSVPAIEFSNYTSVTSRSSIPFTQSLQTPPLLGVTDDGTLLRFLISYDGVSSMEVFNVSRTAWLASGPTKVGFFVNGYNQAVKMHVAHFGANLPGPL